MASDSEASCVSDPNFAVICSFLEKFGASCGVTSPDFLELQEMLENTQEVPQELIDLHIKLLRKVRRSVSADRWERVLIKLCHLHCSQDAWELERFGYKKARLSSKLRILKMLLETQFDLNQKFKAEVNRLTASELKTEPIGRDKHGHAYWYQIDEHCQLRVYREDPDEETWVLVANDREGLARLISQLASDDPNLGDPVLNEDSNSLEIEKPILDTGQTSSSASICEADESSGGNEDSKDVSSEPQTEVSPAETSPTETSPTETSPTETSATEILTPVKEKLELKVKPPESNLKFTISAGTIISHKKEEQPENLAKKEEIIKPVKLSEKPVGIDLSIPQSITRPQIKGVDLTSKRKKSINDLAANLRMKSVDLLYKNPVQEQEMDLSVKKPCMDPKQFSSLSVPPFEPLSIESALRMSTDYEEESDEEIEEEEDESFDEDEIELPSHMKQPRLDRPTLLGKKKKTYSDEDDDDEEYGEEIEEPVMLIQGEGSGKDCNNENIFICDDYSEAVEEPVMFFYGEGSGHDCDTGNTGKEDETSSSNKNSNDLKDSEVKSNTLESGCELRTIKVTESATNSEVLESTDKTVLDCDSKDAKSDIKGTSQENEVSPKSHKIGTIMLDIKSRDKGTTSSKKISRWDIGKPVVSPKNVADSTGKELCDDSTNSSIKNNENSDLLNVSKDETDNTISDISVVTAVNKKSELHKLDKSDQDLDNKETELENSLADTHEALTDKKTDELQKSETLKTDDGKKPSMFFFGPGCFTFKTPNPPNYPDYKGSSTKLLEPKELQEKTDQENETCTEKLKSESVPTCINKADIIIDSKEHTTFLQTTHLSSELKSMDDISENVDIIKEVVTEIDSSDNTISSIVKNVDETKNISELKENTCIPETETKTSIIDNKESLPTEKVQQNVEELNKSDNNSSIVEESPTTEIKNDIKEKIINENSVTPTEEENKMPEENQSENVSSKSVEPNLKSTASKEDKIESEENEQNNSEESKINIEETTPDEEETKIENNDTPENEIKIDTENSNKSEENMAVDLDEITDKDLKESVENVEIDSSSIEKLESKEESENITVEQQNKTEIELNKVPNAGLSSNITDETAITEIKTLVENVAQNTSNIETNVESCISNEKSAEDNSETTEENKDTAKNNLINVEKSSDPDSTKGSDENIDDKSETLSETLESLSTLIETESKSDESDDQLKKSGNADDNSNSNLQIVESDSNPNDEKSENDMKSTEENEAVTPEKEISVESTEKNSDFGNSNQVNPEEQISISKEEEKLAEKNTDNNNEDLAEQPEINSAVVEENITNTELEQSPVTSLKVEAEVNKEKSDKLVEQHLISNAIRTEDISVTLHENKETAEETMDTDVESFDVVEPKDEKLNIDITNDISVSNIEKDIPAQEDGSKSIANTSANMQPPSYVAETSENKNVSEKSKPELPADEEVETIPEKAKLETTNQSNAETEVTVTESDSKIVNETIKLVDIEDENSESVITVDKAQSNKTISETAADVLPSAITEDTNTEIVNPVAESVSKVSNDETKSETIDDGLPTTTLEAKNAEIVDLVVENKSKVQNDETKPETKADKDTEMVLSIVESINNTKIDEIKSETIVDDPAPTIIDDKNPEYIAEPLFEVQKDETKTIVDDHPTTTEAKDAEIVNSVVDSKPENDVTKTIFDELPPEAIKDENVETVSPNESTSEKIAVELITREKDDVAAIADAESDVEPMAITEEKENVETESNSDLPATKSTTAEETKNIETESNESKVEIITDNNDSKPETVVDDKTITEIKINIVDKSVHQNEVHESNPEKIDKSTTVKSSEEIIHITEIKSSEPELELQERIKDTSPEKNIEMQHDSTNNSTGVSTETETEKKNETHILLTNSGSTKETIKVDSVENTGTSKKEMKVENKPGILNEPIVTGKKQNVEESTQDKVSNNEESTAKEISKNETEVCFKIEPEVITKNITGLKESHVAKILPNKDEISTKKDDRKDVSKSETVTLTDDIKQNCNIISESVLSKTVESAHNLEDQKDTEQNSKYFKNDSVEVNHVTVKKDIENKYIDEKSNKSNLRNPKEIVKLNEKHSIEVKVKETVTVKNIESLLMRTEDKISKSVLENPKKVIENKPEVTETKEISEKLKESVSDKISPASEPPVTVEIVSKINESKTKKSTKITALQPEIAKEKSNIKIYEIDEEEKSAKNIKVNSHEREMKKVNISKPKDNLKPDTVFDTIKETNDTSTVCKTTPKDPVNIQKEKKGMKDVINLEQNKDDSSDDDMMDSCAFDQGNDNNDDSDAEEISIVKIDKIQEKEPKLNHSEITVKNTENKIVLKNIKDLIDPESAITVHKIQLKKIDPESEITVHKIEVKKIDSIKEKLEKSGVTFTRIPPKPKVSENKTELKPKLICVDITKLQGKPPPPKPKNKTVVKLKQQSKISSPQLLEPVRIDNEESDDVIDIPETDPLACSEEEILMSKKIEENTRRSGRLSLSTFKLDATEEADTSALIPVPIARALRNRKVSVDITSKRKRSTDGPVADVSVGKRRRGRGRPPVNMGNRQEVESKQDSSSEEEIDNTPEVKVVIPQRGTGKARRGRAIRGRGRVVPNVEKIADDSPVLSSDVQSETSKNEIPSSPAEQQKTPTPKKKRRVEVDPELIIKVEEKSGSDEHTTRSSVRQSRRIAQIKIKEQAERRKIEELTYVEIKEEHKKKKKKHDDKDYKQDKKKKKYKVTTEEDESEDEVVESSKTKHKKKRKHQDMRKLFNTSNPWQSSSESSTSNEEEEEEIEEEPSDEEAAVLKSDHEFSPESDLESNVEVQPLRRARTVKKESDTEEPADEHACQKCGKADHPEWILLCDKCDCGWHCSCLRPALLVIPEGDWFCPPCQHNSLIEALKVQLVDYDKKVDRKEMEVRRKQRLAYVGISLDNVLPSKETEGTKENDENTTDQQIRPEDDSSESESGSESGSSSGDESEPIYQLRERRQAHSYRFNDYDELINSAIQDDMEVKGAGNQGRGKDIATIVNAEKEEAQALIEQQKLEEPELDRPPPVVPVYETKPQQELEASGESSDEEPRVVPKHVGKKKHRKLNSLDISSEDDAIDDDDFKVTSASDEDDLEELGSGDSDEMVGRRGRGKFGPTRRSTRTRTKRFDEDFINDNSEDDAPKKKKNRSIWDESESEESDKDWGKKKKSKKQRHSSTPRTSKKSRKRKRHIDDSDPEVRSRPKKPKIKFGGLNDSDDEEMLTRRTRGKKINYIDALGTDSDEDKPDKQRKTKPLESEDEYVANEEDEDVDEPINPVEDIEKDSDSDTAEVRPPLFQRKIIKIIAPSKVAKGRGKGGMPRPQHLKPVTPPPVVPEPEKPLEEPEEEEESEPPVPVDIPVIAANPDDLNDEEVGTMMMENEEYANKQLELMAIQLAKEKKKKEAQKLAEKKEVVPVTPELPLPTGPKKRGRKKKSELEAIAAAAAAAAAAATASAAAQDSSNSNPAFASPVTPTPQLEPCEKLTPPGEIPATISDLSNSPPKRRGRGKGRKTLEKEAAKYAGSGEAPSTEVPLPLTPNTSVSPNVNTIPNIPTPAQNDPQNPAIHGGKLGIATPPQPFSQNQPTPSVITRMLQSQPISAQSFTANANAMNQKYFPPEQQPPRGPQFPPIAGRGRVPSPYRQSPPAMGMYPGVRPMAPNSPHRLQMFHSTHHSMDPSPSGGGSINIAPNNRDRSSPTKEGPTPPPPPYSRTLTVNRFSPNENSPGPSLPPPIRHHMFPQASPPPPRPPPPGNFSPYHPPPPPNYHYGAYPPAPSLAAADDALPPTDYQGSPYPEHYNTAEGTVHSSEGSNSKPFDEEGSGEFGGLVSYFSSQREDDLDT